MEIGQGARTVLAQTVAEELALPEFGMSPYDQATNSSRSTTLLGLALQTAAQDLRQQLLEIAAEHLHVHIDHLALRGCG